VRQMRQCVSLLCGLLLGVGLASSQVSSGTILVEVRDASGAAIPGAAVTLTHVATGQVRHGECSDAGFARFAFMPVGDYELVTERVGFQRQTMTGIDLRVDQTTSIPVVLQLGEVRQNIEVQGSAPLLEAATSTVGQVVENKKIIDLPLNGRNAFNLGLLAGNTTPVTGMGTNLPFVGGGGRFSSNDVMLDGVDDNTTANGGTIGRSGIAYTPSVDAVQEFKVQTHNFSAEFGYSTGVVMNATTRSGTNSYHGSMYEFLRNNDLDATNFFTNSTGQHKPKFRQNQFGGVFGGPIIRKRTFFFADYEGLRQRTAAGTQIEGVPPPAFRQGDFSQLTAPIYDPAARRMGSSGTVISTPFPGNQIPTARLNATSLAIIGLVPQPNTGAPGALSSNYFFAAPHGLNTDSGDIRVDHALTSKDQLFGRFSISDSSSPTPGNFLGFIGGNTQTVTNPRQAMINDTHIFSPTLVNEFRFGYSRYNSSIIGDAIDGVGFAKQNNLALYPFPQQGFPQIDFSYSGSNSGTGAAEFTSWGGGNAQFSIENRFQWSDNLNLTRGGHTFKMGTDIRRLRIDTLKGTPFYGDDTFGSIFTSSSDHAGSGAPLADFLLGYPSNISGLQMLDWGREREIYWGTYFQDDWKVSRTLTLNLGVRYDLFTQPVDARNLGSLFNVATGEFQLVGQNGFSRAIAKADHNNVAPRLGFAWQAGPMFAIRGGYGIFYGMRDRNQQTTQFSGNPPNTPNYSFPAANANLTVSPGATINTPIVALPSDPTLKSFNVQNLYPGNFRTEDFDNSKFPLVQQANVSFQFEPKQNWLIELNLTGARGSDLTSGFFNRNTLPFSAALQGQNTQANRPFPNVQGWILETVSIAKSNYNSANLRLEKRFSSGLNFLANYTFSKNIVDDGEGVNQFSTMSAMFLDAYNPQKDRRLSALDVPQVFVASYGYELPWGPGRPWLNSGPLGKILGGWQVNGITTLRGGFISDVQTNLVPPTFNTYNIADRVLGQPLLVQQNRGPDHYINPNAFRVPVTVLGTNGQPVQTYGDAGRGVVRGPGSVNFDFSVFREARFKERYRLQIRGEFFNLMNTPTFFLASAGGVSTSCNGTPGGPCTNPQFGTLVNGTATGRQVQFGLKLLF
jgi:hypothetical protein